jgi:guanine nucleotide-binding protein alpha-1 subunit
MGVVEDGFEVNIHGKLVNWRIYDVGGSRGQRHMWAPYFDDINAIIFVAPVSAFDQVLIVIHCGEGPLILRALF